MSPLWRVNKKVAIPAAGANTKAGLAQGGQPIEESFLKGKRNVIITNVGWVRRHNKTDMHSNVRSWDEFIVASNPGIPNISYASNTFMSFPDIAQVYVSSNSTGGSALMRNAVANVYVVFNHPIRINGGSVGAKITVSNTATGNTMRATCLGTNGPTNVINANNTVVFTFKPSVAGSYKINAQTIVNNQTGSITWVSRNTGNPAANLQITGAAANTGFTVFTVRSATTGG